MIRLFELHVIYLCSHEVALSHFITYGHMNWKGYPLWVLLYYISHLHIVGNIPKSVVMLQLIWSHQIKHLKSFLSPNDAEQYSISITHDVPIAISQLVKILWIN